jgi:hypothetical protein
MIKESLLAVTVNINDALPNVGTNPDRIQTIMSVVFAIMGAVAVLIIVLAGIKFVISRGDPQATATARRAIIYAAVGLVVLVMAFAIVTFTLNVL